MNTVTYLYSNGWTHMFLFKGKNVLIVTKETGKQYLEPRVSVQFLSYYIFCYIIFPFHFIYTLASSYVSDSSMLIGYYM